MINDEADGDIMIKQNLHTHSTFCDGKNTIEEVIITAIEKGFDSIGFSSHSFMPFKHQGKGSLIPEEKPLYLRELMRLKEKYKGIIDVYKGIEFELYSQDDLEGYDYTIGSCHFFNINGEMVNFDSGASEVPVVIEKYFGGDSMAMAREYYKTLAMLPQKHKFDIVGHFDIVTKNCQRVPCFDEDSKEYQNYALEALCALCEKIKIFEINTGPIARGYRTRPYPAPFILKEIKERGCHVTVSSDCHKKEFLDADFDTAYELARYCGFKEIMVFDGKEFVPSPL